MKSQTNSKNIIFFAYQGKFKNMADENAEAIKAAIRSFNQFQHHYEAKSWEDYKKTAFISQEILTAISQAEVFVADLSYFNWPR